ncbi:MAG: phosphoribosyl-AMP cyclohydrolase [Armatimonadetes bacterium]|nr:phosphoribosyl-AMP cyclohydrolase [Armatimonadota bacterium]
MPEQEQSVAIWDDLKYDGAGLIPAVVQDSENGQVLMVAYMNAASVRMTLETRRATFWSRSRSKFWIKGESSGHVQHLVSLAVDCDKDCLLVAVKQEGPACHEGYRSCFFREVTGEGERLTVVAEQLKTPEEIYGAKPVA